MYKIYHIKKIVITTTATNNDDNIFSRLTKEDMQLIWEHRYYCQRHEYSLPKILASAPSWDWNNVTKIHKLLHHWPSLSPVYALELLGSKYVPHKYATKCQMPVQDILFVCFRFFFVVNLPTILPTFYLKLQYIIAMLNQGL